MLYLRMLGLILSLALLAAIVGWPMYEAFRHHHSEATHITEDLQK